MTFGGIILGHAHGGRKFPSSIHSHIGSWILVPIFAQLGLGIYLKLHIHERTIRPYAVRAHGILGRVWPILGWVQGLFGVITLRGFCGEVGAGQCAAHYIMVGPRIMTSFGRSSSKSLGKRIHCLWYHYGALTRFRRQLGPPQRPQSGVVGFMGDHALGAHITDVQCAPAKRVTGYSQYVH